MNDEQYVHLIDLRDIKVSPPENVDVFTYEDVMQVDTLAMEAYEIARRKVFAVVPHPIRRELLSENQRAALAALDAAEAYRNYVRDAYYKQKSNPGFS